MRTQFSPSALINGIHCNVPILEQVQPLLALASVSASVVFEQLCGEICVCVCVFVSVYNCVTAKLLRCDDVLSLHSPS